MKLENAERELPDGFDVQEAPYAYLTAVVEEFLGRPLSPAALLADMTP